MYMETTKEFYQSPAMEMTDIKMEGVICLSGGDPKEYVNPFGGEEELTF